MKKSSPLLRDLFDSYFKLHVRPHVSRPNEVKRGFELHWQSIALKRANELNSYILQQWIVETAERAGSQTANRQFNNVRACLNWAEDMSLVTFAKNPCEGVKKMPVKERECYVSQDDEFARLKAVLDSQVSDIHDALWMLLWTAQRKSNVLQMKWDDIDFTGRVWVIQSSESKNRKTLRVPITDFAMQILKRRAAKFRLRSKWVFPGSTDLSSHLVNIDYRWRQIRKEAQLGDLHIHDLRHTAASWMGQNGGSAFAIQRMLGHSSSKMTERYTHLNIAAIRNEMEAAQSAVLK